MWKKDNHSYQVKESPSNQTFSPRERHSRSRPYLLKKQKAFEDPKCKEQARKHVVCLEDHPQVKTFSFNEKKHLKITREENKHTSLSSTPKDQTFKSIPSLSMQRKHLKVFEKRTST